MSIANLRKNHGDGRNSEGQIERKAPIFPEDIEACLLPVCSGVIQREKMIVAKNRKCVLMPQGNKSQLLHFANILMMLKQLEIEISEDNERVSTISCECNGITQTIYGFKAKQVLISMSFPGNDYIYFSSSDFSTRKVLKNNYGETDMPVIYDEQNIDHKGEETKNVHATLFAFHEIQSFYRDFIELTEKIKPN